MAQDYSTFYNKHTTFPHHYFTLYYHQKLVEILAYIANKGPFDIQIHVSFLAQYTTMPTVYNMFQALQVFKYLHSTRNSSYMYISAYPTFNHGNLMEHHCNPSY